MRLKSIKLSGFKSFVDATSLRLPGNLIGVVGPNGCGKSNIIDAVRWVMGESSARHLRGDSMADVIFNGSSERKPVSTATVELVFDNSEGRAGGEYAGYAEISVKRQVAREGQSTYFLNNTRCRRRDITDIFLGTGLGPRSYSIIEQGMISRIVESKPEEMRVYLEEAAGISKYKERRRETEHRIRRTRDNLDRLNDLRDEVAKHLERLDRQARQAERYKLFKAEQQRKKAEARALKWRDIDREQRQAGEVLAGLDRQVEEAVANLRRIEREVEERRAGHAQAVDDVATMQAELYRVGSAIARAEQNIAHRKQSHDSGQKALSEARRDQQQIESHLDLDRAHLAELNRAIATAEPDLEAARKVEEAAALALAEIESAIKDSNEQWEDFNRRREEVNRTTEVDRARISALDRTLSERVNRLDQLTAERSQISTDETSAAIGSLEQARSEQHANAERLQAAVVSADEDFAQMQRTAHDARESLNNVRNELSDSRASLRSLTVLQQAALGEDEGDRAAWLSARGLADAPRLAQVLSVDPGAEELIEAALGGFLDAVVVSDPWRWIDESDPPAGLTLVAETSAPRPHRGMGMLLDAPAAVYDLLAHFEADQLPASGDARTAREDGLTGGRYWIRFGEAGPTAGVIGREREIRRLKERCEELAAGEASAQEALTQATQRVAELERMREQMRGEFHAARRRVAEIDGQLEAQRTRLRGLKERIERLDAERAGLESALSRERDDVRAVRGRLESQVELMAELESERVTIEGRRRELAMQGEEARKNARDGQRRAHELAVALESHRSAQRSTGQGVKRNEERLVELRKREASIQEQIDQLLAPLKGEEEALKAQLDERLKTEKGLSELRAKSDEWAHVLREGEAARQTADQEIQSRREALTAAQVRGEGLRVRAEAVLEEIERTDYTLKQLLEQLSDDAELGAWESDVERLEHKIRRLEPVNLAAIDEFKEEQERKAYLDAQDADLVKALETLEDAIAKIDRKTRTRFKETFERVNKGVQDLFPRLFGGGHGYLELTGDDLLSTGVAIMARPPGKRVTNIHLLSGGEKALTAVAVVFSIFRLNPAPFCMLDEVDAPLDDANVGRFSELVKEMSEQVQFVVVTHNKITMEIAHQLMGVTMREPGVSRMVSVDVAEAARLAAES